MMRYEDKEEDAEVEEQPAHEERLRAERIWLSNYNHGRICDDEYKEAAKVDWGVNG